MRPLDERHDPNPVHQPAGDFVNKPPHPYQPGQSVRTDDGQLGVTTASPRRGRNGIVTIDVMLIDGNSPVIYPVEDLAITHLIERFDEPGLFLQADHPHSNPGDGRTACPNCGKWVWLVTHSCKGVRVIDHQSTEEGTSKSD